MPTNPEANVTFQPDGMALVRIAGEWRLGAGIPAVGDILKDIGPGRGVSLVGFEAKGLAGWDSGLLTFLIKVMEACDKGGVSVDRAGLPEGVRRLIELAMAVPERKGARREVKRVPFLERLGGAAVGSWRSAKEILAFIGEATVAFVRMLAGRARFRHQDFFLTVQESGAQALFIVALISLLVGLILAFVGAIQLRMFGAQVYVADIVAIAMVRVMGAIMTGIIMAGRTGAAFAAQLGTMQTNEEIDALQTLGISPMEYLVLPRILALMLMMPLLCLYADLSGIAGGFIVGVGMLDITPTQYLNQTKEAISLTNVGIGLFHGAVYGVIVALAGCLRGMQCGRSASAVGEAATSAVVTAIVSIIVATAVITFSCEVLGI